MFCTSDVCGINVSQISFFHSKVGLFSLQVSLDEWKSKQSADVFLRP